MATATIHIHPTAINRACIESLQARTGRLAVTSGKTAQLVSHRRFSNNTAPKQATGKGFFTAWPDGDGPSAA